MAIYKNITGVVTETKLIEKGKQVSGGISKILISNNSANTCDTSIYFYDGTSKYYTIQNLSIPGTVSLVLGDNLAFNADTYDLMIDTAGVSPSLSVTIK